MNVHYEPVSFEVQPPVVHGPHRKVHAHPEKVHFVPVNVPLHPVNVHVRRRNVLHAPAIVNGGTPLRAKLMVAQLSELCLVFQLSELDERSAAIVSRPRPGTREKRKRPGISNFAVDMPYSD